MGYKYGEEDTCRVSWCKNNPVSKYLCSTHYSYEYVNGKGSGENHVPKSERLSSKDRFLKLYEVNSKTGCWDWKGGIDSEGYGFFSHEGRCYRSHRLSLIFSGGLLPDRGEHVHHKCSNRSCINPDHLQIVTHHQNSAEMLERKSYLTRINALEEEVRALESIAETLGLDV